MSKDLRNILIAAAVSMGVMMIVNRVDFLKKLILGTRA